jgi:predicted nucleic acid-binding protein
MPDDHASDCFVDTNIWLYAFVEAGDSSKSAIASTLILDIEPVISTQVINEVCVNLLRQASFSEEQIAELIEAFYGKYRVVELGRAALLTASRLRRTYSLSFWDSTIVSAALSAGASLLYSEDMQHGMLFEGRLQVRNPFTAKG